MQEKSGHSVVAVELSPTHLKLVEFFPFDHRITAVAVEALDADRWEDNLYLKNQIQSAMELHTRAASTEIVSAIYAGHAHLRVVEISSDEENYLGALQWDMGQYLARPLNEYVMDYQSLGSNAAETGRVYLVAAYRRSEVDRLKRIWEAAGFPLAILDVDAFALINTLEANYPSVKSERTFLIQADAQGVLCIRTQHGMFQGYDVIPIDTSLLDAARETCANFENAEMNWGKIERVFLCGDLAASSRFREALETGLSVTPILLDAFKEMKFADDVDMQNIAHGAHCASTVGLTLRRAGDC